MSLFADGQDEAFKCAIHGGLLVLGAESCAYNAIVARTRGTGWHVFSAVVYGALVLLELVQVARHTGKQART